LSCPFRLNLQPRSVGLVTDPFPPSPSADLEATFLPRGLAGGLERTHKDDPFFPFPGRRIGSLEATDLLFSRKSFFSSWRSPFVLPLPLLKWDLCQFPNVTGPNSPFFFSRGMSVFLVGSTQGQPMARQLPPLFFFFFPPQEVHDSVLFPNFLRVGGSPRIPLFPRATLRRPGGLTRRPFLFPVMQAFVSKPSKKEGGNLKKNWIAFPLGG